MKAISLVLQGFLSALFLVGCGENAAQIQSSAPDVKAAQNKFQAKVYSSDEISALRAEVLKRLESGSPPDAVNGLQGGFTPIYGIETTPPSPAPPPPPKPKTWAELVTNGVIADYITIIQTIDGRAKTLEGLGEPRSQDTLDYVDILKRKNKRIILHQKVTYQAQNPWVFTKPGESPVEYSKLCDKICKKLIFENYAENLAYVFYDVKTGGILSDLSREFRRAENCHDYSYGTPALGLCLELVTENAKQDISQADGLHIYEKTGSPHWPKGFYPDPIQVPNSRRVVTLPAPAFEHLKHLNGTTNRTEHRAYALRHGGKLIDNYVGHDYSCIKTRLTLPRETLNFLITEASGAASSVFLNDRREICTNAVPTKRKIQDVLPWNSLSAQLDYASIISPQNIEANLNKAHRDKSYDVTAIIRDLQQRHPEFQTDIGYRVAPIVKDLAKSNFGKHDHNNSIDKILMQMPHESMSPYVDDLIRIIEETTEGLGCVDLKCSKKEKGRQPVLWKLAQILNGAGPSAAPFLDRLQEANEEVGGSMGGSWFPIGGGRQAAACIGQMGPEMEKFITKSAYGRTHIRDNNFNFHAEQSLRMTAQSATARQYIEDKLKWMIEKSKDPEMQPSWAKTKGLLRSIERTEKILEAWTVLEPYCPSRQNHRTAW